MSMRIFCNRCGVEVARYEHQSWEAKPPQHQCNDSHTFLELSPFGHGAWPPGEWGTCKECGLPLELSNLYRHRTWHQSCK